MLALQLAEESQQVEAARLRLATGQPARLSDLGELDMHAFGLFLGLLGEALTEQAGPDAPWNGRPATACCTSGSSRWPTTAAPGSTRPRGVFAGATI